MHTDEKVRQELDRKDKVEYLKARNQDELTMSMLKVKRSQSPAKRSPYKSPLKADYKSPAKHF